MSKLYFRYGAMNCGKTTALLQVAHNYEERGMKVIVLKPEIDTKGNDKIVTRIVFAVIIFLVPTIVGLLFKLIPVADSDKNVNIQCATWSDCWKEAGE